MPHIASDASVLYKLCLQIFACNSLEKPYMCSELSISIGRTLSDGKLLPSCSLCAFSCLLTNDYISKICVRQLRSADTRTLVVRSDAQQFWRKDLCRRRTTSLEQPPNLRLCGLSYGQFRRLLKTLLCGQQGHGTV